ncbi:MAG: DoxX family protein [Bacteroidetes bacterium]|nr:DoxX family protein [Bacteroidota bacterium]
MSPKTLKISYWTTTIIFVLFMTMDGIGGVTQQKDGQEAFKMLGYPMYLLLIVGSAKLLGVIGLLQTYSPIVKEWAYAGFTFNFICAALSWAFVGEHTAFAIFPLVVLVIMATNYYLWKRYLSLY